MQLSKLARQNVDETMVSPFSEIRRLREQRMWMCQTDEQYEFIYKCVNQFWNKYFKERQQQSV